MKGRSLWITGIATLVLFAVLGVVDEDLKQTGGPGIVALELEFTSENARETLGQWGEDGRQSARLSLGIDFAFLVAYAAFLSLAVVALGDALGWQRLSALAVLPLGAAVCDAIENTALLLVIGRDGAQPWPLAAGIFASVKFALLLPVLLFVVVGSVAWAGRRVRRR